MNTWHGAKASWDRICEKMASGEDTESIDDSESVEDIESIDDIESGEDAESIDDTVAADDTATASRDVRAPASDNALTDDNAPANDGAPVLVVSGLSFRYPFADQRCLNDISFTAGKGEIIGVTGPVGSGKSALAAALSGLYPYDGEAFIYGVALKDSAASRGGMISYMDSEQFVFSDSVTFNVTLDRQGADPGLALELACMTEDIKTFEDGMDTRLMERGLRVSGGQRQRISLARAWYGDAKILLLDDPFSAIDIAMERRIMENIRREIRSRTVIIFSHRLSTFDMTDRVIVIEKGRVSQVGSHEELMGEEGLYKIIYLAQKFMEKEATV
jgi:ABC-type multidrug transport system fused ATPase/permease subunit